MLPALPISIVYGIPGPKATFMARDGDIDRFGIALHWFIGLLSRLCCILAIK